MPVEDRTHVRTEPDTGLLDSLDDSACESLRLLPRGCTTAGRWTGSPPWSTPCRRSRSAPLEAKAATPELKAAQRQFFVLLTGCLIGKDTGPGCPTPLLAVGEERLRHSSAPRDRRRAGRRRGRRPPTRAPAADAAAH